jgi:hypothetical protein
MHDYLHACFPTFVPKPEIGGAMKKFKPDFSGTHYVTPRTLNAELGIHF